jgi:hypothetical protein
MAGEIRFTTRSKNPRRLALTRGSLPRQIMEKLGYGPERRLKVKVSVRDLPFFRDPAVIMIDQLKEVYIDGELEMIDTANWLPKVICARTTPLGSARWVAVPTPTRTST